MAVSMGAICNNARHTHISIPRRSERIEMHAHVYTCVHTCACMRVRARERDWLGMERWTGRGGDHA